MTRLHEPLAIGIVSIIIGIAAFAVTVFFGRDAGITCLLILCGLYAIAGLAEKKGLLSIIVTLIAGVVIAGSTALLLGYVLVRHVITI